MDATILRKSLQAILSRELIERLCQKHGLIERVRKLDIVALIYSLILSSGSDDSGRLADAYRLYHVEAKEPVVRGAFYNWIDEKLASLLKELLGVVILQTHENKAVLGGKLATVKDWIIVDSETVTLKKSKELKQKYPATHKGAGLKVHKEISIGRGRLLNYRKSPAKEHDAKKFEVDARLSEMGILIDLGYASLRLIRQCNRHKTKFIIRLKENWQPQISRLTEGVLTREFFEGMNFRFALKQGWLELDGKPIDAEVTLGQGRGRVKARLVGVKCPDGYHFYLTNLPTETHSPQDVSDIYRVRWEIEIDNKQDKSGSRLDQVQAERICSAEILIYAALLHTHLVNTLVYEDRVERLQTEACTRAPLHRLLVSHTIRAQTERIIALLQRPDEAQEEWERLARLVYSLGHDANWRGRPSVLDRFLGLTAPAGRGRRKKLADCPETARSYRRVKVAA